MIADRVRSGRLLYMGRSAGAMAASVDLGYTYEPMPLLDPWLEPREISQVMIYDIRNVVYCIYIYNLCKRIDAQARWG